MIIISGRRISLIISIITILFTKVASQLGEITPQGSAKEINSETSIVSDYDSGKGESLKDSKSEYNVVYVKYVPVEDTYIGCVNGSEILEKVFYFNISQVMQSEEYEAKYDTKESSVCFNFCLNSAPSQFISVQASFGNSTQSCGCHDELQNTMQIEDDKLCEKTPGFLKLYCGPKNFDCFNSAQNLGKNSLLIFLISVFIFIFLY
ncbi:UNVERIFIED_CONTAM: hypothetical protein RMT77_011419 [Armadillidium vulgare]